jgi:hypothetical protein
LQACEDAHTTLVGKLNFLVGAVDENGVESLRRSTTECARGPERDMVRGVGEREERIMGEKSESTHNAVTYPIYTERVVWA